MGMKLLWIGDAADTGFGVVTREIGKRLIAVGHDVRFIMTNMTGSPLPEPFASRSWDRRAFGDQMGLGMLVEHGFRDGWRPDQIVMLADYYAAEETVYGGGRSAAWGRVPTWHYVPVEGTGLPPSWANPSPHGLPPGLWSFLRPVAMTRFGADEITRITQRPTPWIYHGVDRAIFHPATTETPIIGQGGAILTSKADCRRNLGIDPSHTVLFRADRFMPRKGYGQMLRAIAPVFEARDDLRLVVHCRPRDFGGNLKHLFSQYPVFSGRAMLTEAHDTWQGVPANILAAMYNAADIYLNTGAEGFGLCAAESVACGTPVLGIDFSSLPEVVGPAGVLIDDLVLVNNPYDHVWAFPRERSYAKALRRMLYPGEAARLGAHGPEHAKRFDWDEAARQFAALFESADMAVAA